MITDWQLFYLRPLETHSKILKEYLPKPRVSYQYRAFVSISLTRFTVCNRGTYIGTYVLPLLSGSEKNKEEQTIINRKGAIANTRVDRFIIPVTWMLERH